MPQALICDWSIIMLRVGFEGLCFLVEPSPEHHRFPLFRHSTKNKPPLPNQNQTSDQDVHAIHVQSVDQKVKENLTASPASYHAQEKGNLDVSRSSRKTHRLLKCHKIERPFRGFDADDFSRIAYITL